MKEPLIAQIGKFSLNIDDGNANNYNNNNNNHGHYHEASFSTV
jgi:hypothetical protein